MKKRRYITISIAVVTLLSATMFVCSRQDRPIPEKKFEKIVREAFLSNAYLSNSSYPIDILDTIDIYTPILAKYGFTIRNFDATMAKYARERSMRITDVLSSVGRELDKERETIQLAIGREDTIRNRIKNRFSTPLYNEKNILIDAIEDTSKLRILIEVPSRGELLVEYSYFLDSLDRNEGLRSSTTTIRYGGERKVQERSWLYTRMRDRNERFSMQVEASDSVVEIALAGYPKEKTKRPNLKINSVDVTLYLTEEDGFVAASEEYTPNLHPKYDYTNDWNKEVLSPPRIDIRWIREQKDSLDRPEGADSIDRGLRGEY